MSGITIRGSRPDPDGVEIIDAHRRASDGERQRLISHLNEMHAQGLLPVRLHARRVDAAEKAETTYDLQRLMADLPGYPEPKRNPLHMLRSRSALEEYFRANLDSKGFRWVFHSVAGFLAVAWAVVPTAFLVATQTTAGNVLAVFFVLTGILAFILNAVAGIFYGLDQ